MFRNPLGRTARAGSLVMGVALAGVSITPLFPAVSAATNRPTISPAPLVFPFQTLSAQPALAVFHAPKPKLKNPLAGLASWYGAVLHGHHSADGEVFDEHLLTAAHNSLPFGTMVRVVDTSTGRSVTVRITDRGILSPGRIIDLSSAAATDLGIMSQGVAHVRLEVLKKAEALEARAATE